MSLLLALDQGENASGSGDIAVSGSGAPTAGAAGAGAVLVSGVGAALVLALGAGSVIVGGTATGSLPAFHASERVVAVVPDAAVVAWPDPFMGPVVQDPGAIAVGPESATLAPGEAPVVSYSDVPRTMVVAQERLVIEAPENGA